MKYFVGFAGHLAGGLDGHNVLRAGCAQLLGLDILCAADCGECCSLILAGGGGDFRGLSGLAGQGSDAMGSGGHPL